MASKKHRHYLQGLSADEQTHELCLAFIEDDPFSIVHVKKKTVALCQAAVQGDRHALDYVDLPIDRWMCPETDELSNWTQVLAATPNTGGGSFIITTEFTLYPLVREILKYRFPESIWVRETPDGRYLLDWMVDFTRELSRVATDRPEDDDELIQQLQQRVDHQVEQLLKTSSVEESLPDTDAWPQSQDCSL